MFYEPLFNFLFNFLWFKFLLVLAILQLLSVARADLFVVVLDDWWVRLQDRGLVSELLNEEGLSGLIEFHSKMDWDVATKAMLSLDACLHAL